MQRDHRNNIRAMKKDLDKATAAVEKAKSKDAKDQAESIRQALALKILLTEEEFER